MNYSPLLVAALAAPMLVAQGAPPIAPDLVRAIQTEGLEKSGVMRFQDHLCNQIGGRLTGSDNFVTACNWARDEFRKLGLTAELEQWGEWNMVWNRGQWMGRILTPEPLELQVATDAWTAPTKGRQQGTLVRVPKNAAELKALREKGIHKFFLYGSRPRGELGEALQKTPPAGYVRSAASGRIDRRYKTQIRVFGNRRVAMGSWDKRPKTPEIYVRGDQAKQIEKLLDEDTPITAEFDIRNRFRNQKAPLYNVIAELKGTEKPNEYVYVCGHLDSWHQATGATDNGTGTCATLEVARILTAVGAKPKRTIRFALWGGEEQGLLGSGGHTTMRRQEMTNVSAVFNHDTGTNWAHSLSVTSAIEAAMKGVVAPLFKMKSPQPEFDGETFVLRTTSRMSGGGGSDHASFLRAGVPAWSIGLQSKDNVSYGYGWHSQWDTYDLVVPEYQAHTSTVLALLALGAANLPEKLPRAGVGGGRGNDATRYLDSFLGLKTSTKLEVTGIKPKTFAANANLKVGDRIQSVLDRPVKTRSDLLRAVFRGMQSLEPDEKVELVVLRAGAKVTLRAPRPERRGSGRRGGNRRPQDQRPSAPKKPAPKKKGVNR